MRALTVRQPWAWAIIHGGKDVENRSRNLAGSYRGPVAIHVATSGSLMSSFREVQRIRPDLPRDELPWTSFDHGIPNAGHIIGVVDLVDVHHATGCWDDAHCEATLERRWCSPWAQRDHHHLVLANPRPLAEPIPYRGLLGLWTLPGHVVGVCEHEDLSCPPGTCDWSGRDGRDG